MNIFIRYFKLLLIVILSLIFLLSLSFLMKYFNTNNLNSNIEKSSDFIWKGNYPIHTNITLKYWCLLNGNLSSSVTNYNETPFAKELEKQTGVRIEYIHVPNESKNETFNIMIASNYLPDMIEWNWTNVMGGPEKAIDDGLILNLNSTIDNFAPNLKQYISNHVEIDKNIKTDNKNYYVFPFVREDKDLQVFLGPVIRKDLLDELGLSVPTTIDEWHTVLKSFKEQKRIQSPISTSPFDLRHPSFIGAYGIMADWYMENDKVKYGRIDSRYKDFLITMNKWYKEGLLDKNFSSAYNKTLESQLLEGNVGATILFAGNGLGRLLQLGQQSNPKFDLIAVPSAVLYKGQKPQFGHLAPAFDGNYSVAISKSSQNVELAARWLDFGYSDKGHMLFNFGIENESYSLIKDYPTYTDLIINNPNKYPINQALSMYSRAPFGGAMVQDKRYFSQYLKLPQQKEAIKTWSNTKQENYTLPNILPTAEEGTILAHIMNEVKTYSDEMFIKFVMGIEPLDSFDSYVAEIKKMNIDKAIQIQQTALQRYKNR